MTRYIQCPEKSELIIDLLDLFQVLKREQIIIYLMQRDLTFNRERCEKMIEDLEKAGVLFITKDDCVSLDSEKKPNKNIIAAFWVLLRHLDTETEFDLGRYPAEIVFKDDKVNEIVVCREDMEEKMDFLSKRIKRKNLSHIYFLMLSNVIEEINDDFFPDVPFDIITVEKGKGKEPRLMYHNIYSEVENSTANESEKDAGYEYE